MSRKEVVKLSPVSKLRTEIASLQQEIKNDVVGPVVASFGFIIALIWRDAIKGAIDHYLSQMGLADKAYMYNFISAIIVTIVVIIIMVIVTKFGNANKKKQISKRLNDVVEK